MASEGVVVSRAHQTYLRAYHLQEIEEFVCRLNAHAPYFGHIEGSRAPGQSSDVMLLGDVVNNNIAFWSRAASPRRIVVHKCGGATR